MGFVKCTLCVKYAFACEMPVGVVCPSSYARIKLNFDVRLNSGGYRHCFGYKGFISFHIRRKSNISQCVALFHILQSKIFHLLSNNRKERTKLDVLSFRLSKKSPDIGDFFDNLSSPIRRALFLEYACNYFIPF